MATPYTLILARVSLTISELAIKREGTLTLALTYFNYSQTSHIVYDYPVLKRITNIKEL